MQLHSLAQLDKLVREIATFAEDPTRTDWGHPIESGDDYATWQVPTPIMVWTLQQEWQSPLKATFKLRPNTFPLEYDYLVIEAEYGNDGSVKELTIAVVIPAHVLRTSVPDQVHYLKADIDTDQVVMETHEGTTEIWTDAIGDGTGRACDLQKLQGSIVGIIRNKTWDWMFAPVPQGALAAVG